MSAKSIWTPIGEKEIKDWRKKLPEGHTRESNAARSTGAGWDPVKADGDTVTIEGPEVETTPEGQQFIHPLMEREAAEEVFGQVWQWAQKNPQAYQLAIQIMKNSNPEAYGHLSNDELQTKVREHAEAAARKATQDVYEKQREARIWGVSH